MGRITPADIPSQSQMIASSLFRDELEQEYIKYTGLKRGTILKDHARVVEKDDILFLNEWVVKYLCDMARTALGPFGHDKMVSKDLGDLPPIRYVYVTNDIFEFLNLVEFSHPVARLALDMAKAVDTEVGDGVASALVLAGALVTRGCDLVRKGIHPSIVSEGYDEALKMCIGFLEEMAEPINGSEKNLYSVALSSIRNKGADLIEDDLAKTVVNIYKKMRGSGKYYFDMSDLKIERTIGKSLSDTVFVDGVILRNEVVHDGMPKRVEGGRVALISKPIVTRDFDKPVGYDHIVFEFEEKTAYNSYSRYREKVLLESADKIVSSGANVLFLTKGVDEIVIDVLVKKGILTVRRVVPEDMDRIARATGGTVVAYPSQLSGEVLGYAKLVEERKIGDSEWIIVEGAYSGPQSILITAPHVEMARDAEHLILNSVRALSSLGVEPKVLPGGGVALVEAAIRLRRSAWRSDPMKAVVLEAFADALEHVHAAIVENAGYDVVNVMAEVRRMHEEGASDAGFDVIWGGFRRFVSAGIIDPLPTVRQALTSAVHFAKTILKTDNIFFIPRTRRELMEKRKAERKRKGKRPGDWVEEKQY
ncbi:60 kDa chaperonin 1 [archaeon HR01]|nr:60 kDa chaperonin 1 [archaeon HR01]